MAMELIRSPQKIFKETILIVPFFGAEKFNLKRHREWLNQLGYDVVLFDLNDDLTQAHKYFISWKGQIGMKHAWTNQISEFLDQIPGDKIILSFSNPSASAIEAISKRKAIDIRGLICDGGPSGRLRHSMMNYFEFEKPIRSPMIRWLASVTIANLWHPRYHKIIHEDLEKIPSGFPLLSIRGKKDPIISVRMIDMLFDQHSHIALEKLLIPEGGHLNGLKDFPEIYKPRVEKFLKKISNTVAP